MIAGLRHRLTSPSEQAIDRLIIWTAALLVVAIAGFGAYYYYDRQANGSPSPLARETRAFTDAVRANPNDLGARLGLASLLFTQNRYSEAVEQYRAALLIDETSMLALTGLGQALVADGKRDEAVTYFEKIVNAAEAADVPGTAVATAHYFLGTILLEKGDPPAAIAELRAAIAIDRADADAWYQLGAAHLANQQADAAIAALVQATRFVPDFAEAYEKLALAYDHKGLPSEARYARAMEAYSGGQLSRAASELEAVTRSAPEFAPGHVGLGLVRERQGQRDVAVAAYRRALEVDDADFNAHAGLVRLGAIGGLTASTTPGEPP